MTHLWSGGEIRVCGRKVKKSSKIDHLPLNVSIPKNEPTLMDLLFYEEHGYLEVRFSIKF